MLHNFDWLCDLNIHYDASSFDTDPFEPQPDSVNTIFPFWVDRRNGSGYVERIDPRRMKVVKRIHVAGANSLWDVTFGAGAVWGTVGVSENIIEASWVALVDSIEYKLFKDEKASEPEA